MRAFLTTPTHREKDKCPQMNETITGIEVGHRFGRLITPDPANTYGENYRYDLGQSGADFTREMAEEGLLLRQFTKALDDSRNLAQLMTGPEADEAEFGMRWREHENSVQDLVCGLLGRKYRIVLLEEDPPK